MGDFDQDRMEVEIERVRTALEAEFEEFVSMAAHNLRDSLRDVAAFSQLMAETYDGRLDSDAAVFLARIREGAARMQSLLADMVDYWAAGTGGRQSSPTDMEAVLRQALLSTDKQLTERSAIVTHDPLPAVPAFQDRVFGAFKRLHGNELPGNGLGLAFCRKAIQWHGGRMWLESASGAGATFYFTLPPASIADNLR
jgi:light-regulated signal transduction histidine kinase (bacteriophytochrome)